jgi:hypothetical protein
MNLFGARAPVPLASPRVGTTTIDSVRAPKLVIAAALAAFALPSAAGANSDAGITTVLVTRAADGGLPNAASQDPVVSLDAKFASVLAFQSTASNLVSLPTGGVQNVFYVPRAKPYDTHAPPWVPKAPVLVSRAQAGHAPNGPSSLPAVGADNNHAPSCIAFVSNASNLVSGDTNGKPDAFVYFLRSRAIKRVSLNAKGKQSNGTAFDVTVNGKCTQVAFTDDATNLVPGASKPTKQVYMRYVVKPKVKKHHRAPPLTSVVSRVRGHNGNADSWSPTYAPLSDDLAFVSRATNFASGTGGNSEVYGFGKRLGSFKLLSKTSSGKPGNGDSDQPAIGQSAKGYAFRTRAPNLAIGAPSISQIVHVRIGAYGLRTAGPASNGDSAHPTLAVSGHYVIFQSAGSTFGGSGRAIGVYLFTDTRNIVITQSKSSDGTALSMDAVNPVTSEAANYIFFETSDPFADHNFVNQRYPVWNRDAQGTRQQAATDPAFHQIYLRYFGSG